MSDTPREPHIYTPSHDPGRCCLQCGRPFESYVAQPDTTERMRLAVQSIPFALPEKRQCGTCEKCAPVLDGLSGAEQMAKLAEAKRAMARCPFAPAGEAR